MRRYFIWLLLICFFELIAAPQEKDLSKPNIIYILADDLGYGDIGCYGQQLFSTPNIDKLAENGIKFTQHYAGSTVCAPSRSVLMTGQHTGHTFIRGNKEVSPEGQYPLAPSVITVAELLKEVGYATGAFGKWGLGAPGSEGDPNNQGFDTFFGYNCQRLAHNYYPWHLWHNQDKVIIDNNEGYATGTYGPILIQEKALEFIETNKSTPFFLFLPTTLPHAELLAPYENIEKYRGKLDPEHSYIGVDSGPGFRTGSYGSQPECHAAFAGMIDLLDAQVGQIVAKVEELGISENTLILFSSDNGPHMEGGAQPNFFDSNGPLKGYKRDLYEGGIRVPLIAYWPNTITPGSSSDHISYFGDFLPTVTDLIGEAAPSNCDGISFLPQLTNEGSQIEHDYLYWEFHEGGGKQAIRIGPWKGIKLNVMNNPEGGWLLYNLDEDISESNNLADQHPDIIEQLNAILKSARTPSEVFPFVETLEPIILPDNPDAFYTFEGNANDITGNGWHAAEDKGIVFVDDAERGKVAQFNNTYSMITGHKGWAGAAPRSISLWFKTTAGDKVFTSMGTKTAAGKFVFLVNGNGQLRLEVESGYSIGSKTSINDGKWHHIAVTYDGTGNVGNVKFYIDGEPDVVSVINDQAVNTVPGVDMGIGYDIQNINRTFIGQMDDLHFWDKAISEAEVAQLYNTSLDFEKIIGPYIRLSGLKMQMKIENSGQLTPIKIFDVTGKCTHQLAMPAGSKIVEFQQSGIYVVVIYEDKKIRSQKVFITK